MTRPIVEALTDKLRLEPLPLEGGLFRQTWVGEERDGRPVGTAIVVLLAAEGGHFSAMHRLPIDEVWFFQAGDPIELLLLEPGTAGPRRDARAGRARRPRAPGRGRGRDVDGRPDRARRRSGACSRRRWRPASSPPTTTPATARRSAMPGRSTAPLIRELTRSG